MIQAAFSGDGPPGALKICILSGEEYHPWNPSRFLQEYHWELYELNRLNSVHIVQELVKRDFDLFFNFCDADWTEPYPGPEVIRALEQAGVAFTGGNSTFYDPSRESMKRVCHLYDLHTPESVEAYCEADISRAIEILRFPLIVKSYNSYGSVGIERNSRVGTPEALYEQARRIMGEFGGALIEEFIEGREFTVLVAENPEDPSQPKAYRPIEWIFPPGESFKHYDMKWVLYKDMPAVPLDDPILSERLMEAGRKLFLGINGVSFGRCDIRVNPAGDIYILEINPQSSLFDPIDDPGDTDFVLFNDPDGHSGFIDLIFRAALTRQRRLRPKWVVRYGDRCGYGLYAQQAISEGELILSFEKRPHTLVSLSQVRQTWPLEQQAIFFRHAYPLSDDIWIVPSNNPSNWTPVNHACNPNAWWHGLDIIARRGIAEGEEITLDYATYHNELMPEFPCSCQSENCRKQIRGSDYLQPFVEQYEGHHSDYIHQKRREHR
jgi:hypothetical protein